MTSPDAPYATIFRMTHIVLKDRVLALPKAADTNTPKDAERDVRSYLKKRLKQAGGELRKCSWFMRKDAPDELILLSHEKHRRGCFAELKRPGKLPTEAQLREAAKLHAAGFEVYLIDSREAVDAVLFW